MVGISFDCINNWLYDCLKEMLKNVELFETAIAFKQFLNVRPSDKIDIIKAAPIIEKQLNDKYKINISGDVSDISSVISHEVINLKCIMSTLR